MPEITRDRITVGFAAMVLQGHPELECAEPAGKLDRFLEVGECLTRIVVENPDIVSAVRECFATSLDGLCSPRRDFGKSEHQELPRRWPQNMVLEYVGVHFVCNLRIAEPVLSGPNLEPPRKGT